MKKINLQPLSIFGDVADERIIACGLLGNGEIYWLELLNKPDYLEEKNTGAIFAKIIPEKANSYIIHSIKNGKYRNFTIKNQKLNYHFPLPLAANKWLFMTSRSRFDKKRKTGDKNARMIDETGALLNEYCFGDGIEKIVFLNNEIWTSYFDEGVFGNFGWEQPIGKSGLVCWDLNGKLVYEYNNPKAESIDDCYAMNADGENLYIHYYSSFPLVKIDKDKKCTTLDIDFEGSDFAVFNEYFLFRKAYAEDNSLFLFKRENNKLKLVKELKINEKGKPITNFGTYSSGQYLLIREGRILYRLDMKDCI